MRKSARSDDSVPGALSRGVSVSLSNISTVTSNSVRTSGASMVVSPTAGSMSAKYDSASVARQISNLGENRGRGRVSTSNK